MLDTLDELGLSDRVVGLPKQTLPSYLKKYKDSKYESVPLLCLIVTVSFLEEDFASVSAALFPQAATTRTVINAIINKDSFFNSSHLII